MNAKAQLRNDRRDTHTLHWHPNGRWATIRCFWTFPLGHEYEETGYGDYRCVGCRHKDDPYSGAA